MLFVMLAPWWINRWVWWINRWVCLSSILSESRGKLLILFELGLVNWGLSALHGSQEVIPIDPADIKVRLIFKVKPTHILTVFTFFARRILAIRKFSELFGKLQSPNRLIDSITHQNCHITATVVLAVLSKFVKVLFSKVVRSILHTSF